MITRQNEKKAATSSSNTTPRATSRKSDISSKKLCENCKSLLSSDNMVSLSKLCKLYEDINNGILKFEKSLAVINDRAENVSISLESIKTESISKLECLELSIQNKFKDIEKRITEISESLHTDIDINRENATSNTNVMHRNNKENDDINNILIYGDSNTKHIDLSNSYTECTRIATYRISDIDVNKCSGFKTI